MRERIDFDFPSGRRLSIEIQTTDVETHGFFSHYHRAWRELVGYVADGLGAAAIGAANPPLSKGDGTGEP